MKRAMISFLSHTRMIIGEYHTCTEIKVYTELDEVKYDK